MKSTFVLIIIICNIFEISVLKNLICLIVTDILLLLVATSTMLMDWRSSSSFGHQRSGTRSDSDRMLQILRFSDEEVHNPFGLFYTLDRVRVQVFKVWVQVISDITKLLTKL